MVAFKINNKDLFKTVTIEEIKKRIKQIHGDVVTIDDSTYIGCSKRAEFVDKEYGSFVSFVYSVVCRGSGHPKRSIDRKAKKRILSIENVKLRIERIYGNIVSIDESTYEGTNKKARFIDREYGEWWTKPSKVIDRGQGHPIRGTEKQKQTMLDRHGACNPSNVTKFQEKRKQTFIEHLGADNPMKIGEIALRCARSQHNSGIIKHWKTGEDCIWVASYERVVLEWLNKNQIEYSWQKEVFQLLNGHTYRPDLYLIDEDKWIEIKGYFRREDAREKWEWFHKEHPNSELWDYNKLKELGILRPKGKDRTQT
jgi:hypothetical protein